MNKIIWYLKQLFPFTYVSKYMQVDNGEWSTKDNIRGYIDRISIWKMWMGKCYNIQTFTLE